MKALPVTPELLDHVRRWSEGLPAGRSAGLLRRVGRADGPARRAWQRAGVADRVELRLGDARTTLRTLEGEPPVDLAFVDADEEGYPEHVERLLPHLRSGGLLVLDDTLRGGEVLPPTPPAAPERCVS